MLDDSLQESAPDILTVAGISIAVAWSFTVSMLPDIMNADQYAQANSFTQRAEQRPQFLATPRV